jgi:hypothetical protein
MHPLPNILNAASNLLGICFVIIGALKLADADSRSYADETTWAAAALFLVSILCSYSAIRSNDTRRWLTIAADAAFFGAIGLLSLAMLIAAIVL